MIVYYGEQPLIFEFGFKGLILLNENTRNSGEDLDFWLYCGLIKHQPWLSFQDCKLVGQQLSQNEKESLQQYINQNYSPLSQVEMAELYSQAVGEIGIQPSCFYSMNREEVNLAYDGYVRRKQLEANLGVMAINASKGNYKPIRLIDDKGYEIGNDQEREKTFQALGIEV